MRRACMIWHDNICCLAINRTSTTKDQSSIQQTRPLLTGGLAPMKFAIRYLIACRHVMASKDDGHTSCEKLVMCYHFSLSLHTDLYPRFFLCILYSQPHPNRPPPPQHLVFVKLECEKTKKD